MQRDLNLRLLRRLWESQQRSELFNSNLHQNGFSASALPEVFHLNLTFENMSHKLDMLTLSLTSYFY